MKQKMELQKMKQIIRKSMLFTAKLDGQLLRTVLFVSSLIIFSLIAGAPFTNGAGGG
jgi:hypothetical protein